MKLKILIITTEYPGITDVVGGLAIYTQKIARELSRRGIDVRVVTYAPFNKTFKDCEVFIYCVKVPNLFEYINSKSSVLRFIRFVRILYSSWKLKNYVASVYKNFKYDLIHTTNYLFPAYFLVKKINVPIVCRISSYAPLLNSAFGAKRNFAETLIEYFEIKLMQDSAKVFAPSQYIGNVVSKFESLEVDTIISPFSKNNEIKEDISLLTELKNKINNQKYILYWGSMSKVKGVDLLDKTIQRVCELYEDINFVFIGRDYGFGNGLSVQEYLKRRCGKYFKKCHYYDFVSKAKLVPVIKNSHLCIMPSRVDNTPNVVLEAMQYSIPVVGSHESSIDEHIMDGINGFLAKNSDSNDFADKVIQYLSLSDKQVEKMKINSKDIYRKMIAKNYVNKLISYYKSTINEYEKKY